MRHKSILLTLSFSFFLSSSFAQVTLSEKDYHQVAQRAGSENLVKEYLSSLPESADTIYAILFVPMMCPRCEVDINLWFENLYKIDPNTETLLICPYNSRNMVERYCKIKGFETKNLIVDTSGIYQSVFAFSTVAPRVTYIMKIDRKNGRLIVGGDFIDLNPQVVHSFYNHTTPQAYIIPANGTKVETRTMWCGNVMPKIDKSLQKHSN